MKKRIFSAVLTLVMVFALLPVQVFAAPQNVAYNANSSRNATITVQDADTRERINNATLSITRTSGNTTYVFEYISKGNGQYGFTRNTVSAGQRFTITVEAPGYEPTTVTMSGSSTNTVVRLTAAEVVEDEFAECKIFYIADGNVPDTYAGAGDAEDYGPSANNTPLVLINVNITKLREIAAQNNAPVVYRTNTSAGNSWEFVPAGNRSDSDYEDKMNAYWAAVISCTDEDSISLFEDTGLYNVFVGYCLKKQSDGSIHGDGVLSVEPPVYVVELYEQHTNTGNQPVYFGGGVTDTDGVFLTADDILGQYEARLQRTITWAEDQQTGKPILHQPDEQCEYPHYTGTYISSTTYKIHTIWVYQYNAENAQEVENSEIPYVRQTDTYYLALFNMRINQGVEVNHLVTYTDGIDTEEIFTEHEYNALHNQTVPAFTGVTIREDHTFIGWYLVGDDSGKIYSDEDIAKLTVQTDMVFHAVWVAVPKHTATVNVVLNGTYDPEKQTLISGSLVDADTVFEDKDSVKLYLSADGEKYHTLGRVDTGVYSTTVKNGVYHVYYGEEGEYIQFADQAIIVENADRTRYLFFNSVAYDPNGGIYEGSRDVHTEYHYSGNAVNVCHMEPTRDGYIFLGWKDREGNILQPNQLLTDSVSRAYELTAQWAEKVDVYVELEIRHRPESGGADNTDDRRDITFTLDSREQGSTGDYTELNRWTIDTTIANWGDDGKTTVTGVSPVYNGTNVDHVTTYAPQSANLVGVRGDLGYTVTTHKSGYTLESVTPTREDGKLTLKAVLVYDPEMADLTFQVKLDEETKDLQLDSSLLPAAVNVKVTTWYDAPQEEGEGYAWQTFTPMLTTYERVALDAEGEGRGSYPVWMWHSEGASVPYRYRIEVVSYELKDGTIVAADDLEKPNVQYVSENKRFFADIKVDGVEKPILDGLTGAYFDNKTQIGTITAVISIPAYTITLDPNGGKLEDTTDSKILEKQIVVPDISVYEPQRDGGYLFEGWYLADAQGNMTDTQVFSETALTTDITLLAKWRDPITVSGMVTTAGTYEQKDENGNVIALRYIQPGDRVKTITVLLQKRLPSGYYETVDQRHVDLNYDLTEYYFQKTPTLRVPVGVGFYDFAHLPDDGTQYRIFILSANYHSTYQNEPESEMATEQLRYNYYEQFDYEALLGGVEPNVATVNAHLHFDPPVFDLHYRVDASEIGESFRPDSAEILVTYDADPSVVSPSDWPVIGDMTFDDGYKGKEVAITDGIGNGVLPLWKTTHDGANAYDYGIRVFDVTTDGKTTAYDPQNPYYTITYHAPAYYVSATDRQSQLLIAKLIPRTYGITYNANGGTIYGEHVTSHTWSKETVLTEVIPVRSGYQFDGWYLDEALTKPLDFNTIDASVAEELTLYAKWIQVNVHLHVFIDHRAPGGGVSQTYDKTLLAQLTSRSVDTEEEYLPMDGYVKEYDDNYWHTRGDSMELDALEIHSIYTGLDDAWDYNMNVSLDGYYVAESYSFTNVEGETETIHTGVTKEVIKTSTETVIEHHVDVCLKFEPDMLQLEFSVEMADGVDKALYPVSAEVKVSCWYENLDDVLGWHSITQHTDTVVEVALDPQTGNGFGVGSYPVWQWMNKAHRVPYYYRVSVAALKMSDGSIIALDEQEEDVTYSGGGYAATVCADNGCQKPQTVTANGNIIQAQTQLLGAYGTENAQGGYDQQGQLRVVIGAGKVVFHANNTDALCHDAKTGDDTFRTYYPAAAPLPEGEYYNLSQDGSVPSFYEIPQFAYEAHNNYIFKGWYTKEGEPVAWQDVSLAGTTEELHLYARWIEVGTVDKEEADKKQTGSNTYHGFDLIGAQIRDQEKDEMEHYGNPGSGLRFITVLSEDVYGQINAIKGNEAGAEYGFVIAKSDTARKYAADAQNYTLQYVGENVNGVNTQTDYKYAKNMKSSGVVDHYDGEKYRLYTAVVTYGSQQGDALEAAYATDFVARSYIRYNDANGLLRTHYNNYTGTQLYGGCSVSFATVRDMVSGQ